MNMMVKADSKRTTASGFGASASGKRYGRTGLNPGEGGDRNA